jgi:hypothetical protein
MRYDVVTILGTGDDVVMIPCTSTTRSKDRVSEDVELLNVTPKTCNVPVIHLVAYRTRTLAPGRGAQAALRSISLRSIVNTVVSLRMERLPAGCGKEAACRCWLTIPSVPRSHDF